MYLLQRMSMLLRYWIKPRSGELEKFTSLLRADGQVDLGKNCPKQKSVPEKLPEQKTVAGSCRPVNAAINPS